MERDIMKSLKKRAFFSFLVFMLFGLPATLFAEVSSDTISQFTSVPINLTDNDVAPQVMLNASNDHQLFFKVYDDYSDLDGGGVETTYKHSIDYYGYFDCKKCYEYDVADQRFEPRAITTDKYCKATDGNGGYWSGNFLNWASMTRIDAVRKILFGGHRRVDTSTETVLERAFLPPDIHSFAKHYAGNDVEDLTPYTPNITAPAGTSGDAETIGTGNKFLSATTLTGNSVKIGDYVTIADSTAPTTNYMSGWVTAFNSGTGAMTVNVQATTGAGAFANWIVTNHTRVGITIANVTYASGNVMSEDVTDPPLIRVAEGNYAFWGSGEITQCLWEEEEPNASHGVNWNNPEISGIYASLNNPRESRVGMAPYGDFVARVQVCVDGLIGDERVKQYPYGNYKPVGLLQIYGDENSLLFGMAAGTYGNPRTGADMVAKIYNQDGATAMMREVNLGKDVDGDGDVDDDDDFVDANHNIGDGTFKLVYQSAGGPITGATKSFGIMNTWSLMRIVGYEYGVWNYNANQADACPLSINFFGDESDSECRNWGNPFSEIYLTSLRYFAGLQNSPLGYQVNTEAIDGMNYDHGTDPDPLTELNYCARLNTINFNSSIISADTAYPADTDELDNNSLGIEKDIEAPEPSKFYTDIIGFHEGIHGNNWFVGENSIVNNRRCTSKVVTSLGDVRGLCPEGPNLQGGFRIAGLAYYVHTRDIRPAGNNRELNGSQKVDTFSIKMASGAPVIEIPVPGSATEKVTILPASMCNNKDDYSGTLVDFKIIQPHTETIVGQRATGKFLVIWEDSLQGNDYDLDAGATIRYEIDSLANTIRVWTDVALQNLGYQLGMGYVISGTTEDGLHIHSGTNGFTYDDDEAAVTDCAAGCSNATGETDYTYTLGNSSASLLEDPLWYAAKWGGFVDSNNNNLPDIQSEWDKMDNDTGAMGSDGVPDNYFYAANPAQLETSLNRVFLSILQRASSGTAAAVVANNVSGIGALYQAYYEPLRKDTLGNQATWIGTVQSLWLDSAGYLREDDGDAELEGYLTDNVIQMYYDDLENKTRVRRYISTKDDTFSPYSMTGTVTAYDSGTGDVTFDINEISGAVGLGPFNNWDVYNRTNGMTVSSATSASITAAGNSITFRVTPLINWVNVGDTVMVAHFDWTTVELEDIRTIWNAREQLSFSKADPTNQRVFDTKAEDAVVGNGIRHIKTWIDADGDSVVDATEFIDFDSLSVTATNYGFFNVATEAEAENLVDYIRGEEIPGYRGRTVDYDADGSTEVIRLGDIINSTPTVVGAPQERLDLLYKDTTYTTFYTKYKNRRQMVYVGGNDGMLHAFNGGFYNSATQSFKTTDGGASTVEHPLGAEIWAYVPMNLQPHLKWLKDPNYTHVYYVDAKPKVFDAKIFTNDADHPDGWGTILVVGMRFGGGAMTIDTEADGFKNNDADDREFKSAYIIMDVTNPESAPKLLAEIQVPDGSFSTSYPAALTVNTATKKWYLVFGSGPTSIASADSDQNAKFYVFDLDEINSPGASSASTPLDCTRIDVGDGGTMKILSCDTGVANSFVGDPVSVDWELNYKANGVYFGLVGDSDADSGRVMRFATNEETDWGNWDSPSTLIVTDQPVSASVTPGQDENGQKWIYFGTGRFYVSDDQFSTTTQSIYGVEESGATVSKLNLINVTNAQVEPDGDLTTAIGTSNTVSDLEREIEGAASKGWYLDLPPITGVAGTDPSTRVINSGALAGGILFMSAYQPGVDPCTGEGYSRLYGLYYKTGTAYPNPAVFGTDINAVTSVEYAKPFIELGHGFATVPAIHSGSETGDKEVTVFTQLSTGTIIQTKAQTGGVRSGMESWFEPR